MPDPFRDYLVQPLSFFEDFRVPVPLLITLFCAGLTATQAALMTGISVRSVNPIFLRLRERRVHECRLHSPFLGELEADES
jgi:hypothetical protein